MKCREHKPQWNILLVQHHPRLLEFTFARVYLRRLEIASNVNVCRDTAPRDNRTHYVNYNRIHRYSTLEYGTGAHRHRTQRSTDNAHDFARF